MTNDEQSATLAGVAVDRLVSRGPVVHFLDWWDEDSAASACGLGDYHGHGFSKASRKWDEVTCKRCLRYMPANDSLSGPRAKHYGDTEDERSHD